MIRIFEISVRFGMELFSVSVLRSQFSLVTASVSIVMELTPVIPTA
jgi:hypothetical protein